MCVWEFREQCNQQGENKVEKQKVQKALWGDI
jgi:hypothetical protein